MPLGGTIIAGASLLYGAYNTFSQEKKADDLQKSLKNPIDQIPQEFYQNRELARQMAEIGMPSQQYNNNVNNINQNQATAISAAQKTNNPSSAIAAITRQSNQAKGKLDAEDAQARQNNQRYFIQENSQLGKRKDEQEQANVFDPYTRDFNQMQAYRGSAQTGLNNLLNSGLSYASTLSANKTPKDPNNPTPTNLQIPEEYQNMPGLQGYQNKNVGYNPAPMKKSPFNLDYDEYSPYLNQQ